MCTTSQPRGCRPAAVDYPKASCMHASKHSTNPIGPAFGPTFLHSLCRLSVSAKAVHRSGQCAAHLVEGQLQLMHAVIHMVNPLLSGSRLNALASGDAQAPQMQPRSQPPHRPAGRALRSVADNLDATRAPGAAQRYQLQQVVSGQHMDGSTLSRSPSSLHRCAESKATATPTTSEAGHPLHTCRQHQSRCSSAELQPPQPIVLQLLYG